MPATTPPRKSVSRRSDGEGSKPILRKDGRWQSSIRFVDHEGISRRATRTGATPAAAVDAIGKLRDRLNKGYTAVDSDSLLGDVALAWFEGPLLGRDLAPSTRYNYGNNVRTHIVDSTIGRIPLARLLPGNITTWLGELRNRGLGDATRLGAYKVLRQILDQAVDDKLIVVNPILKVKRPQIRDAVEGLHLTLDEAEDLLAAAEPAYRPLIEFLLDTATRRGEALGLTWANVDFERRTIRLRQTLTWRDGAALVGPMKTKKSRRDFDMTDEMVALLRGVRLGQKEARLAAGASWVESGFVFTGPTGAPIPPHVFQTAFARTRTAAGLRPGITIHSLRHTGATWLILNGTPLKVVSEFLGHATTAMTAEVYAHVLPDVRGAVAIELGRMRRKGDLRDVG